MSATLAPSRVGLRIPGLPEELAFVPDEDPLNPDWRQEWFAWREQIIEYRAMVNDLADHDLAYRAAELKRCAASSAYWLVMYGWIEEPRPRKGEDGQKFYIPFGFQVALLKWIDERLADPDCPDGFVSKARGLGATWIFCAAALHGWLFRSPWRVRLVSRKEELVDKPLDLDSMFGKIDFMLDRLPAWMLPKTYRREDHRLKLLIKNPDTGTTIAGESTSAKSTRGGRATFIVYDEAAFIKDFHTVFGTGAGTTDHRFAISSESFEEGRDFWDAWHAARDINPDAIQELEYTRNPYFDSDWYRREQERWAHDPYGFIREYERDPYAGGSAFIYPTVEELPIVDDVYDPTLPLLVGIDPGHADDTAIVWGQLRLAGSQKGMHWLDSYERNYQPAEFYAHLLTGIPPVPGDEIYGMSFTRHERDLMEWMASLPWNDRIKFFMDPAGNQQHSGISFHYLFAKKTKQVRERWLREQVKAGKDPNDLPKLRPITPLYQALKTRNSHDERHLATRQLLPATVFSTTQGGRRIKEALKNYKLSEPGEKATNEPKPIHSDVSHIVSAVEYVSVYVSLGLGDPPKAAAKPRKTSPFSRIQPPSPGAAQWISV